MNHFLTLTCLWVAVAICADIVWLMVYSTEQTEEFHWPRCMCEGCSILSALTTDTIITLFLWVGDFMFARTCFFCKCTVGENVSLTLFLYNECLKSLIIDGVKMDRLGRIQWGRAPFTNELWMWGYTKSWDITVKILQFVIDCSTVMSGNLL